MVAGPFVASTRWYRAPMALIGPLGPPEIILILVVLSAARRPPERGRALGRGMREFKDAVTGEEKEPSPPAELPAAPSEPSTTEHEPDDAPAEKAERETVSWGSM